MKLRDYQEEAVKGAIRLASVESEVCIYAPPAFGKTISGAYLAKHYISQGKKVAVMVRFSSLIPQLAETFNKVGLNPTVLKANEEVFGSKDCYIVMEQTVVAREIELDIDVLIIDEYSQGYEGGNRAKIKQLFKPDIVIGMDGTPWDSKGHFVPKKEALIETVTTLDLVDRGYLSDVKFYKIASTNEVNDSVIEEINKRGYITDERSYELLKDVNKKLISEVVNKDVCIGSVKDLKSIWFCSSIEHARATADVLRELIPDTYTISNPSLIGSEEKEESVVGLLTSQDGNDKEIIQLFKEGNIRHLVSVAKVSIGFDVPDTIVGVDLRPSGSDKNLIQRQGRIRRKADSKPYGVWIDCVGNLQRLGFDTMPHIEPTKENRKAIEARKRLLNLLSTVDPNIELREGLKVKIEEIQEAKSKALPSLTNKELIDLYEAVTDYYELLDLMVEINKRYGSKKLTSKSQEWLFDKLIWVYKLFEHEPKLQTIIFNQLKKRFKRLIKERKKITSLYFWVDWLLAQSYWRKDFKNAFYNSQEYECQECSEVLPIELFYDKTDTLAHCPVCSSIEKQIVLPYEPKKIYQYEESFEISEEEIQKIINKVEEKIVDLSDDEIPF